MVKGLSKDWYIGFLERLRLGRVEEDGRTPTGKTISGFKFLQAYQICGKLCEIMVRFSSTEHHKRIGLCKLVKTGCFCYDTLCIVYEIGLNSTEMKIPKI